MTEGHKITAVVAAALSLFLICAGYGWVMEREARITVGVQQNEAAKRIDELKADIAANDKQLANQLQAFALAKQSVQTPVQVAQALPQVITLPYAPSQVTEAQAKAAAALTDAPKIHAGDLILPAADLKPLYDAQVDCKVNAVKLDACSKTLTDTNAVGAVKDTEINQLQTALKGGTKWQRAKTVLKAVGVGALVGAGAVAYLKR